MTSPNISVRRAGQSLTPGDLIQLFVIDLTPLEVNQQFAFTPNVDGKMRAPVIFRGITYTPADVQVSGFEFTGQGAIPQPKMAVTNATRIMSSAAILYQDLVGALVIRTRTYRQFLDHGDTPDPEAAYGQDVYSVEQKVSHTKKAITWTLASAMDQEGRMIPGRPIIRDVCMWRYRRWTGSTFDYSRVKCPYTGAQAYDRDGKPTTPDKDTPSRHISTCCKPRFGAAAPLPFGGFAGVNRIRV